MLLALPTAAGVQYWLWHRRVNADLVAAIARLDTDDPGWRLADLEAARQCIPEEDNSARVVVAVAGQLPTHWADASLYDYIRCLSPVERLGRSEYDRICAELEPLGPALAQARRLARVPRGRHRIDYQPNPLDTLLGDQQQVRQVVTLLQHDALRCEADGDDAPVITDCLAALNAARSIGDEPLAISQLIRHACTTEVACEMIARALARNGPPPEGLDALQRLLQDEDEFPALWVSMRGERAIVHEVFDNFERGDITLAKIVGNKDTSPSWQERLCGWYVRDARRAEQALALALQTRYVEQARLPSHEQIVAEWRANAEFAGLPEYAVVTRHYLRAFPRLCEAERRRHAKLRSLITLLAAERYRQVRGRWPQTVADLVPVQLSAMPLDPFDGQPLRYRRLPDGIAVYSVGPDGNDDGGMFDTEQPLRPGADLGFRLWDVTARRHDWN